MIATALLLLPAMAMATNWVLGPTGKSCAFTCGEFNQLCDKDARNSLDTKAKAVAVYSDLKLTCTFYGADTRGPFQFDHGRGMYECQFATKGLNLDCDQVADVSAANLCACVDPAPAKTCVHPEEEHQVYSDSNGIVHELNQCYFDMTSDCACMERCQEDDDHLSFEWKEGENPNCCCYVNV